MTPLPSFRRRRINQSLRERRIPGTTQRLTAHLKRLENRNITTKAIALGAISSSNASVANTLGISRQLVRYHRNRFLNGSIGNHGGLR
jgi:hypothetical protein